MEIELINGADIEPKNPEPVTQIEDGAIVLLGPAYGRRNRHQLWISHRELNTNDKLVAMTAHLAPKKWVTARHIADVVSFALSSHQ